MVVRATPVRFWNCRMSSISISAWSILDPAGLTLGPLSRLTNSWLNTAFIGLMADSGSLSCSRSGRSSTPALTAAS